MVVTGAGGKAFVSGADISRFEKERSDEAAVKRYSEVVEKSYRGVPRVPQADHRDDPRLLHRRRHGARDLLRPAHLHGTLDASRVPAAKLGLGYGYTGLKRLVDIVGPSFAMEIFYTARQFTAAEARVMGLVNRVVPDGELEKYVKDYADTIAGNAPLTIKAVKVTVAEV